LGKFKKIKDSIIQIIKYPLLDIRASARIVKSAEPKLIKPVWKAVGANQYSPAGKECLGRMFIRPYGRPQFFHAFALF